MLVERARQEMLQAIRSLAMTVDRWGAAWKPIEEDAPWYAEVVMHHKFSTDRGREDSATRCPACGSHGHIAHGERRRCKCGLRMRLAGNSLALWTGRIPQHSADLALPARETKLIQLERHKRLSSYIVEPEDAVEHRDEEVYREREVASVHAQRNLSTTLRQCAVQGALT